MHRIRGSRSHDRGRSEPVNDEQKSAYRLFVDRLSGRRGHYGGLYRLLDPDNTSVTLSTLQRAAAVVGKRVHMSLEDIRLR